MSIIVQITIAALVAAGACLLLVNLLGGVAKAVGWVDKPDTRKNHTGEIPLVGGICVFFSALLALAVTGTPLWAWSPLLVGSILLFVGVVDDRFALSARLRLPIQAGAALAMIHFGGLGIESIGDITGSGPVILSGWVSVAFTIMCTVGVINSINMIDGVDGLSGSIIFLTFLPVAYFSWLAKDYGSVTLLVSCLAAILVFLYFNARLFRSKAAVFMGDAGSMLLGFVLVWFLIRLTQGGSAVLSPIAAGWIFGLPLADTVSVMVGRVLNRQSPFSADRNHLHHKFLDSGFSVNETVLLMVIIHSMFIALGMLGNTSQTYEPVLFWLFVVIVITHYFATDRAIARLMKIKRRLALDQ